VRGTPTALGALVTPALDYAASLGLDVDALLTRAGLPTPFDSEARVNTATLLSLWEEAALRSGDAFFGLHAGEHYVAAKSVQIVGFAARQARNLADCYAVTSELGRLTNEGSRIDWTLRAGGVGRLDIGAAAGTPAWPRAYNEMALAAYLSTGRRWTGNPAMKPLTVEFQHAPVANVAEYVRLFGVEPRFSAPINALTFDAASLDLPLSESDPALGAFLKQQARKQLGADADRLVDRVREAVRTELVAGARAAAIAKRLAMSERTLQRRLAETQSGLGLKQIIDEERRLYAIDALTRVGASVADVAHACGFSDVASFREAFKRWTGTAPSAVKRISRTRT
jgi:AraC-like DNA-binding protein